MALNLSRFFGAKSARESFSNNVGTIDGTSSTDGLSVDDKFGPETNAAAIDAAGPALSQLETENGGLDTTPEEPGFGEPVTDSGTLYKGHGSPGENAISIDTWEHAAIGATDTDRILPYL